MEHFFSFFFKLLFGLGGDVGNCFYKHFPSEDHPETHVKEVEIDKKP
jgi:hypothetical protein